MRALWHIWQTALGEWGGAIRSRRALVLLVLYLGAAVLCMNGTISILGKMEKELATMLQLPDSGETGVVSAGAEGRLEVEMRKKLIDFFERFYEKGLKDKLLNIVNSEFAVVEYTEAIELLKKSGKQFDYPVDWGLDLQTEHERYLTDEVFKRPVFVINYPKDIKSFYMKLNPDGKTVAATDLLVPGVGEIIGASQREDDYDLLMKQITDRKMTMDDYVWYTDLRRFGSVPHAGYGLGFERMLMYLTGIGNIRDTIPFPRAKNLLA